MIYLDKKSGATCSVPEREYNDLRQADFINYDIFPNLVIISQALQIEMSALERYRIKSSAYKDNLWVLPLLPNSFKSVSFLIATVWGSKAISQRSGDEGHPCLVPL